MRSKVSNVSYCLSLNLKKPDWVCFRTRSKQFFNLNWTHLLKKCKMDLLKSVLVPSWCRKV